MKKLAELFGVSAEPNHGQTAKHSCNPHVVMKRSEEGRVVSLFEIYSSLLRYLPSNLAFKLHSVEL